MPGFGEYENPTPQFILEIRLSETKQTVVLQKSNILSFKVSDLKPGSMYTAAVKSVNKFGKSEAIFVPFVTQAEPIKTIAETKVKGEKNDENEVLGVILGIVVTVVIMLFVLALVTLSYRRCLLEQPDTSLVLGANKNHLFPRPDTVPREISNRNIIPASPFDFYQQSMPTISSDVLVKVNA